MLFCMPEGKYNMNYLLWDFFKKLRFKSGKKANEKQVFAMTHSHQKSWKSYKTYAILYCKHKYQVASKVTDHTLQNL